MHVQNMSKTRVGSAKDVVKRGQEVWVKVISMQGQKISLSMRDVDQVSVRVMQGSPSLSAEPHPASLHCCLPMTAGNLSRGDSVHSLAKFMYTRVTMPSLKYTSLVLEQNATIW